MKLKLNTILHTRDGRKIGNAIVIGFDSDRVLIKTDYGNELKLTSDDITELFHDQQETTWEEERIRIMLNEVYPHKNAVKL